ACPESPVNLVRRLTALRSICPAGKTHRAPGGTLTCPSLSDVSNSPAYFGASQRFGSRTHRQTHAPAGLSGSTAFGLNVAQPHDQTPLSLYSFATSFTARASSFTTSSHADVGCSEARVAALNCICSVTRAAGMPICVRWFTRPRKL